MTTRPNYSIDPSLSSNRNQRKRLRGGQFAQFAVTLMLTALVVKQTIIGFSFASEGYSNASFGSPSATASSRDFVGNNRRVLSLSELTDGFGNASISAVHSSSCPDDLVFIHNMPQTDNRRQQTDNRKIPRIIHQTSKSRCVTKLFSGAVSQWQNFAQEIPGDAKNESPLWEYYFHDDTAVMTLLRREFPEFPHLRAVAEQCVIHGTLRADLWRYLVLWVYGGLYVDLDAAPNDFTALTIQDDDDGFFVVEQFHLLSQYFMAVSPRHPLMGYAVHHALLNLLYASDTGSIAAAVTTGPHALHRAFQHFRQDVGVQVDPVASGYQPVSKGHFVGTHNRTIRVVGKAEYQNEYINRDVLRHKKLGEYSKMSMTHFQQDKKNRTGQSCLSAMLDLHYKYNETWAMLL